MSPHCIRPAMHSRSVAPVLEPSNATEELKRASDGRPGYASVVVDEAQDLGYQALRMIRALGSKGHRSRERNRR